MGETFLDHVPAFVVEGLTVPLRLGLLEQGLQPTVVRGDVGHVAVLGDHLLIQPLGLVAEVGRVALLEVQEVGVGLVRLLLLHVVGRAVLADDADIGDRRPALHLPRVLGHPRLHDQVLRQCQAGQPLRLAALGRGVEAQEQGCRGRRRARCRVRGRPGPRRGRRRGAGRASWPPGRTRRRRSHCRRRARSAGSPRAWRRAPRGSPRPPTPRRRSGERRPRGRETTFGGPTPAPAPSWPPATPSNSDRCSPRTRP